MAETSGPQSETRDSLVQAAVAHRRARRLEPALAAYERAAALAPDDAEVHGARGDVLRFLARYSEALAAYDRTVALDPDAAGAHLGRGFVLFRLRRPEESIAAFDRAIALQPGLAMAHNGRGSVLFERDLDEPALKSFDRAIALKPDYAEAHLNRAVTLRRMGRFEEAVPAYDRAIALKPAFADAYHFRSLCLLTLGRFADGWRDYERRWEVPTFLAEGAVEVRPEIRARLETGLTRDDLAGRRLLLAGEQGVGDVLMFASILPDLLALSGSVDLVCDARLRRLLSASFPGLGLSDPEAAVQRLAAYDHVLAIGSLGRLFRTRAEDFPGTPYLSPRPEAVARWAERLGPSNGRRRIGVAWRGGKARTGAAARSMDVAELRPLLDLPGCEFVSLQYGAVEDEIAALSARLDNPVRRFPSADIDDFEDLAGLVRNLDLVVSVQQTLVHLCGAIGAPTLVMIPPTPEWRYTASAPTMPWYGSVRLYRRRHDQTWSLVVAQVAEAVAGRMGLNTAGFSN